MLAKRVTGLVPRRGFLAAAAPRTAMSLAPATRAAPLYRSFSQTLVSRQQKGTQKASDAAQAPAAAADFKVDDKVDDYKDVEPTDELYRQKSVAPPVVPPGKQGEAAADLYSLASVYDAAEEVENDFKWLTDASQSAPLFSQFIATGIPDKKLMRRLLQGVLKGAGFHRVTQKYLVDLFEGGELKTAPEIAQAYAEIMKAHRKEIPVVLTFASLPDKQYLQNQIDRIIKFRLPPDAQPQWEFKIKPEIIGGIIVEVGNQFKADFALSDEFTMMRNRLKQLEDKYERVRDKELHIADFDKSNLYKKAGAQQPEIVEEVKKFDLEKFKRIKSLDLQKHEQDLMKKYNISASDSAGVARVKSKIAQIKKIKDMDNKVIGAILQEHNPEAYRKFQQAFAQ